MSERSIYLTAFSLSISFQSLKNFHLDCMNNLQLPLCNV